MYFKKNWGSMAEKDRCLGVLIFFKQALTGAAGYFDSCA